MYDGTVVEYSDGVYVIDYGKNRCVTVKEEYVSDNPREIQEIATKLLNEFQKEKRKALALKLGEHLLSIFEIYKHEIS